MRRWTFGLLALAVTAAVEVHAQTQGPSSSPLTRADVPPLPTAPNRAAQTGTTEKPAQIQAAPKWCADMLATNPDASPIANLYVRLRNEVEPKGQFETTAAAEKRQTEALSLIAAAGHVVVVVPIYAPYDADKRSFDVGQMTSYPLTGFSGLTALRTATFKPIDQDTVTIERSERHASEYQGQNAYGASVTVAKRTIDEYGVALLNLHPKSGANWLRRRFALPMSPERASALDGKLNALIIGDVSRPGMIEDTFRTKPTLHEPKEVTADMHYITLTAACGAIIAKATGEVLYRLN